MQKLFPAVFHIQKVSLTKLIMDCLIILLGQGFGCIIYSELDYYKSALVLSLIFYELGFLESYSPVIVREDNS